MALYNKKSKTRNKQESSKYTCWIKVVCIHKYMTDGIFKYRTDYINVKCGFVPRETM